MNRVPRRLGFRPLLAALATAATLILAAASQEASAQASGESESRLDRLAASGVLRAGTRSDASPFAFRTHGGEFAGFSVDLLNHIRRGLEARLGRSLRLEIEPVTAANRISRVRTGALDIVCGVTTATWEREREVDFSTPFFVDTTKLLTRHDLGRYGLGGLRGRRVGVVANTTTGAIVARRLVSVDLVEYRDLDAAMTALENREVDAVSNIGILLERHRSSSSQGVSLTTIPREGGLQAEALSCVLPLDDSRFRNAVDRVLFDMMAGIEDLSGDYVDLYFTWFGEDGLLYYPLTTDQRAALTAAQYWLR